MYADVVLDVEHHHFEDALELHKEERGVHARHRARRPTTGASWSRDYKAIVEKRTGKPFPQDPREQLWGAIGAVFGSLDEPARHHLPPAATASPTSWGTAVNVQAMVFGNMGDDCATGVAFTRDPSTGENVFYGEFLINAQGEDVVAGIRTPQHLTVARQAGAEVRRCRRWKR